MVFFFYCRIFKVKKPVMRKLIWLFLIPSLFACEPSVLFRGPQPVGKKDLGEFPPKYRGMYQESEDSSVYIIKDLRILEIYRETVAELLNTVVEDEDIEFRNDSLFISEYTGFPALTRNDSVFSHIVFYDTVFDISRGDKLRKMGRSYFLNLPKDTLCLVLRLSFEKPDKAFLCDIDQDREMDLIGRHTSIDTVKNEKGEAGKFILDPTKKELKRLLRLGAFSDTTGYQRISQEPMRY